MPLYLDPRGRSTYGIALCARCSRKFSIEDLYSDPNYPSLMVCKDDLDEYDPYRLAPRHADNITLKFVRPDTSIATDPSGLITDDGNAFIVTDDGEGYLIP